MTNTATDTIPQKEAQRLIDAIARQRDHWSNRFAQFEAQVEALVEAKDAEIAKLKALLNTSPNEVPTSGSNVIDIQPGTAAA